MKIQLTELHSYYDKLQCVLGEPSLAPIYGAGCTKEPKVMLVFMNPTAKNISAKMDWQGMRAPWLGTKNIWHLLESIRGISKKTLMGIKEKKREEWDKNFCEDVYKELSVNKIFVTNLAKCTQSDARPLKNKVFEEYRDLLIKEIEIIKPIKTITFGNQVSSVLLKKKVSVGSYQGKKYESLFINNKAYQIYPIHYPVGQGMRNMSLVVSRLKRLVRC